ncbi:hypothetical protein RIF29_07097 [Crotalaria pallida]|uniref:SUI1 domain-containing protein n=1 Tax=Crotalaria pallida TaxID=3830 RepID=A0AAN9PBW3_CROPI
MFEPEFHNPTSYDPFAEAEESDARGVKEYVHIRIQQRNGKKSVTTVQGLKEEQEPKEEFESGDEVDQNILKKLKKVKKLKEKGKELSFEEKILKTLKKEFCCNGIVVQDKELGKVIQLQGDQRKNVAQFLVQAGLVRKVQIKIHGF